MTPSPLPKLVGLRYSPWTERARWALDHHRLPYRYEEHLILFGMPKLRFELKQWMGGITLPVLMTDSGAFRDSFEIARYADRPDTGGKGTSLFPPSLLQKIEELHALSEAALDAGRALAVWRLPRDAEAQKASLPSFIPESLRGMARPLASLGAAYLTREFEISGKNEHDCMRALRRALEALANGLQASGARGGRFVLGDQLTFADITLAVVLQFVSPVEFKYIPLGEKARPLWSQPDLAHEFKTLVEWRDWIYAQHRPRRMKSAE